MPRSTTLSHIALACLAKAASVQPDETSQFSEARGIWQPDSWLLQRCWQVLADAGAGPAALSVAALTVTRQPLAPLQALYRIASVSAQIADEAQSDARALIRARLDQQDAALFAAQPAADPIPLIDRLLYAAASAAAIGHQTGTFAYLERLDQLPRAWERVFVHPDLRLLLAETVARVGLHPLIADLIDTAVRYFSDSGAQFLQQIADAIRRTAGETAKVHRERLLMRCVDALHNAVLLSLHSRRIAATVMAQAGRIDPMRQQLETIATIQDAHRETGHTHRAGVSTYLGSQYAGDGGRNPESIVLRQVTRPQANADVDFQVHTLQAAVRVLPRASVTAAHRQALARQLAELGVGSDGWTAAGAASSLIQLGDIERAIAVVDHIAPRDPTRSEGIISLVDGLLTAGEVKTAAQQVQKALQWARSLDERMPERALTWGLAEAYLKHGMAQVALQLLGERPDPTWGERLRQLLRGRWPGAEVTDETLRTDRTRLRALLLHEQQQRSQPAESNGTAPNPDLPPVIDALVRQLYYWAPRLLDGEALVHFYIHGLLRPLLEAGKARHAWGLLPQLKEALRALRGTKYAAHVTEVTTMLSAQLDPMAAHHDAAQLDAMQRLLEEFVVALWQADAAQGIWRAVYGVEGSLPLLIKLEGPQAVVDIAQAAAEQGKRWAQ